MPTEVIMPQLGESVVEGTVSRWLKQVGDAVAEYEPLLEVNTDKVDTEIPAPAAGTLLEIRVGEGETVEHGTVLALIGVTGEVTQPSHTNGGHAVAPRRDDETEEDQLHQAFVSSPERAPAPRQRTPDQAPYGGHVTPVVARMVAEHGLDLSQIAGTGHNGRITKKDVEAHLAKRPGPQPKAPATTTPQPVTPDDGLAPWERPGTGDLFKATVDYELDPAPAAALPATPTVAPKTPVAPRPAADDGQPASPDGQLVPHTPMRRAIAEHMVRSKLQTSPHVTTVFEVDLRAVMAHRAAHKEAYAARGVNLTLTAYFAAATVRALAAQPTLNARWTDDGLLLLPRVNLGIAVAVDNGLLVPVIHEADTLNLVGLARALNDVAARARARKLTPQDVQGGTFTISNHGVSGSLFATPIINQPQVGILGVGAVEKRVKVQPDDSLAVRPCAYVSLTFDHRVADGAVADGFLALLKDTLEAWPAQA